jgi:hypothetical protein
MELISLSYKKGFVLMILLSLIVVSCKKENIDHIK